MTQKPVAAWWRNPGRWPYVAAAIASLVTVIVIGHWYDRLFVGVVAALWAPTLLSERMDAYMRPPSRVPRAGRPSAGADTATEGAAGG